MFCLMTLLACSPQTIIKNKEVPILPPDNLLVIPCNKEKAGDTVESLVRAHIENTNCIDQFNTSIQSLIDWKHKQQSIYKSK